MPSLYLPVQRLAVISIVSLLTLAARPAWAGHAEPFAIPTADGLATLTGEVDFPYDAGSSDRQTPVPAVVMMPGTGLFDRDGLLGHSGSDADFLFRDLAQAFNAAGVAAVRFDYRGIHCNTRTMPPCPNCRTNAEIVAYFGRACIDSTVRGGVTPATVRGDLAQVFDYAQALPGIDPGRIAIFAHSEGTLNTARLVAERRIAPRTLVFMGLLGESAASIVHWQTVDRYLRIFDWDADHDGTLSNAEIDVGYVTDPYFKEMGIPAGGLESPSGSWTQSSFTAVLNDAYAETKAAALAAADDAPYGLPDAGGIVIASQSWWKQFFTDDVPVADLLTSFSGPIFVHNGVRDSQTPADREFPFVTVRLDQFAIPPLLRSYPGKGHSLGDNPIYGPIAPDAKRAIVADLMTGLGLEAP